MTLLAKFMHTVRGQTVLKSEGNEWDADEAYGGTHHLELGGAEAGRTG